jgi:hypothetical protein
LGGALSYGGSKLFGGTPAAGSAGKASTGNIFSRVGEYIMPGKMGLVFWVILAKVQAVRMNM